MKSTQQLTPKRIDGEESRQRILDAALKLFATLGFEKTSTRRIAQTAQVNISAIAYYFGDKAGLYRTVFTEAMGKPVDDIARFANPAISLEQALSGFFHGFITPLKQGELSRLCMRLHMREMIEPTGLWQAEIDNSIAPHQQALLAVLQRHLGLNAVDLDLQRLAFCIVAMGVHLYTARDVTERIVPALTANAEALDQMQARITFFAMQLVAAEAERRKT